METRQTRLRAAARAALVALYPCRECGAPIGVDCAAVFGCSAAARRPAVDAAAVTRETLERRESARRALEGPPPYEPRDVATYYGIHGRTDDATVICGLVLLGIQSADPSLAIAALERRGVTDARRIVHAGRTPADSAPVDAWTAAHGYGGQVQ
jgi:hypothetical protein